MSGERRQCRPCNVTWHGADPCWSCGGPSTISDPVIITSQRGSGDGGICYDDVRAAKAGPALLSADPCGSGPL